jgi:hypothetical protein
MKWIQVFIMWCGILTILVLAYVHAKGPFLFFWECTLVVALLTVGLILTVEAITRSKTKGPEEK